MRALPWSLAVVTLSAGLGWHGTFAQAQGANPEQPVPGAHTCARRPAGTTTETDVRAIHLETWLTTTGRAEVDGIHFDVAKATIRAESESVLQAIADLLIKYPSWKLRIEGHTDNVGGVAANLDLSIRRATAVRQALVYRYFVEPDRLTPVGLGPSRPKDTNRTPEGREHNRRVELVRQWSAQ